MAQPNAESGDLRLLIAASPKTGNVWLANFLASAYGLKRLDMTGRSIESLPASGGFVTHKHVLADPGRVAWLGEAKIRAITLVRHPGDVFLSLYHWINAMQPLFASESRIGESPTHMMIGQSLQSDSVRTYLRDHFQSECLEKSRSWMRVPGTPVVRYEELLADPVAAFAHLTNQIRPIPDAALQAAVAANDLDALRGRATDHMRKHFRSGQSGGWARELPPDLIAEMAERLAEVSADLGYSFERPCKTEPQRRWHFWPWSGRRS